VEKIWTETSLNVYLILQLSLLHQ